MKFTPDTRLRQRALELAADLPAKSWRTRDGILDLVARVSLCEELSGLRDESRSEYWRNEALRIQGQLRDTVDRIELASMTVAMRERE